MLQPLQLQDVSLHYAAEIAELRDFLLKAGVAVDTPETLGDIAYQLPRDRSFHRDLSSNIWVVIHMCRGKISYSDLLGVLAIAAAGTRYAAEANEDDAHELLLFLMETRRAMEAVSGAHEAAQPPAPARESAAAIPATPPLRQSVPAIPIAPPAQPPQTTAQPATPRPTAYSAPIRESAPESFLERPEPTPLLEHRAADPEPAPAGIIHPVPHRSLGINRYLTRHAHHEGDHVTAGKPKNNRRLAYLAIAACLLCAIFAGIWYFNRVAKNTLPETANSPAATPTATLSDPARTVGPSGASAPIVDAPQPAPALAPPAEVYSFPKSRHGQPQAMALKEAPKNIREAIALPPPRTYPAPATTSPTPAPAPTQPAPIVRQPAPTVAVTTPPAAAPAPAPRPAATTPTPSPTPANSLGMLGKSAAPRIPTAVSTASLSKSLDSPTVPPDTIAYYENGRPVPVLHRRHMLDTSAAAASATPAAIAAAQSGIVRSEVLGIMAGNILDSPVPAYPVAAAAAHVQGTVKLVADVDRDGNVASVHVVSGPPLLRDAAQDAVQRWRYRPFTARGKALPTTAEAVVDFELQ